MAARGHVPIRYDSTDGTGLVEMVFTATSTQRVYQSDELTVAISLLRTANSTERVWIGRGSGGVLTNQRPT